MNFLFLILLERHESKCTGGPTLEVGCCSQKAPCSVGEGGCRIDSDCEQGLMCGYRNCDPKYFSRRTNCCSGISLE